MVHNKNVNVYIWAYPASSVPLKQWLPSLKPLFVTFVNAATAATTLITSANTMVSCCLYCSDKKCAANDYWLNTLCWSWCSPLLFTLPSCCCSYYWYNGVKCIFLAQAKRILFLIKIIYLSWSPGAGMYFILAGKTMLENFGQLWTCVFLFEDRKSVV